MSASPASQRDPLYEIGKLKGDVASIRETVERLEHTLLGNGQPGVLQMHGSDLEELKTWKATQAAVANYRGDERRKRWQYGQWLMMIGAALTGATAGFIFHLVELSVKAGH